MHQFTKRIPIFLVIAAVIIFFLYIHKKDSSPVPNHSLTSTDSIEATEANTQEKEIEENSQAVVIDLKGEVARPGVYEMEQGDRIQDVIQRAGGFTEDADRLQVNLAQTVQDEMVVFVPAIEEADEETASLSVAVEDQSGKVKINTATKEEIIELPGIGPAKADAIIAHRENHGLFQQTEDLLDVSGIGEKTLENFKEYIQVP